MDYENKRYYLFEAINYAAKWLKEEENYRILGWYYLGRLDFIGNWIGWDQVEAYINREIHERVLQTEEETEKFYSDLRSNFQFLRKHQTASCFLHSTDVEKIKLLGYEK